MRVVVVGGGIVGLATARLLHARGATEVVVLEAEPAVGLHQTGRNSGVVHAGLYYTPDSLKARLCTRGVGLLAEYARAHGLPYEECGKLVVALSEAELPALDALERRGHANGVRGLRRVDAAGLRTIEPNAAGIAALHSPHTAITDFAAVARAFAKDVVDGGGTVRTNAAVARVDVVDGRATVFLSSAEAIAADRVIVCAGLQVAELARRSGASRSPRIMPFRGEYLALAPAAAERVRGLIYPLPDPSLPFLGVHLTRRTDGSVLIGPNAVPAAGLGAYAAGNGNMRDAMRLAAWPGAVRLARKHWRAGLAELRRSRSRGRFVADAARYLPGLTVADVVDAPAGIRAQAVGPDGSLVDDFRVEQQGPITWLRNAPSPAATSSMALAEELLERAGLPAP